LGKRNYRTSERGKKVGRGAIDVRGEGESGFEAATHRALRSGRKKLKKKERRKKKKKED